MHPAFLVLALLFTGVFIVNVYLRLKVVKHYRVLVKQRIQFGAKHIFSDQKMTDEIIVHHPRFKNELLAFSRHLRYSVWLASVFVILTIIFGSVLMYMR